jgi:predicted dehydrogenase
MNLGHSSAGPSTGDPIGVVVGGPSFRTIESVLGEGDRDRRRGLAMESLGIAVVGFGWMGRVHAQAYARVRHHYPAAPRTSFVAVADDVPGRAEEAAAQFGFTTATRDWRDLLEDPRVHAVSITAPNFLHREIGSAFARAGKHIWIEKPVGMTADDARAIVGDVQVSVGFNYRNAPAVERARALLAAGEIGDVTHARVRLFSDYAAHPEGALSWRFERARGGNGVLGDLASHGVDLVRYLLGEIDALVADTAIFVPSRPRPTGATAGHGRASGEPGPVENEDYVGGLLRMASGARVVLEASRVAVAEQNGYGFEIHGTAGALFWDFRRMGELGVAGSADPRFSDEPVRTVFAGPGDGEYAAFQPGAGIAMGYDDLKVIEAYRFLRSIEDGTPHGATLADAVKSAEALDAISRSAATGGWVKLSR